MKELNDSVYFINKKYAFTLYPNKDIRMKKTRQIEQ